MNNILFGSIGVLMLAIVGVGFAEVKYQAHGGDFVNATEQEEVESVNGVAMGATDTVDVVAAASVARDTASFGISQAVAKIEAAYTGKWDDDGEDEDGDDDRGGKNDDDDDDDSRGSPATSATTPPEASKSTNTAVSNTVGTNNTGTVAAGGYTMAQIAAHNTAASCYSAISGNVYDLTSFVSQHPGGASAIKSLCGVDGTAAYNGQHGGSRRPANELASLKIGVLAN